MRRRGTRVRLLDFCAVQSTLARASIEDAAAHAGWRPQLMPMREWLTAQPAVPAHAHYDTVQAVSAVAHVDQATEAREALEVAIEKGLLDTLCRHTRGAPSPPPARPTLQVYTCIDDRECSLRRHIEHLDAGAETHGVAGFFGLPLRYVPADGRGSIVLAPEGQAPRVTLTEVDDAQFPGQVAQYQAKRRSSARWMAAYEGASFSPVGALLASAVTLPVALVRLWLLGYAPLVKQNLRDAFSQWLMPRPHTDFHLPVPTADAAAALARTFKSIGTHDRFAPLVVVLGHGAASANNPFAAAYNCGACGGREGGPNARVFVRAANDPSVRALLSSQHGVHIPDDTCFVSGQHNTTADEIVYFDTHKLPQSHAEAFARAAATLDRARGENALERCHRFLLAKDVSTVQSALRHVRQRSVDPGEVRPELNHATNAAVIVGRRDLTRGSFLDRRVFLPSYDPHSDDARGTLLEAVLAPALTVCSGINLEYLFSTTMATRHGAGTKAPLNVVGNIAVLQGTSGDLRPGLPSQMTEMHTPVRALFIIDAPLARVCAVLERRADDLRQLVHNEWVRFIVRDPDTGLYYHHLGGGAFSAPVDHTHDHDAVPSSRERYALQRAHGLAVTRRESAIYALAVAGMGAVTAWPVASILTGIAAPSMGPHGPLIALAAAGVSLPILAFSRRYLHGEFMFGRFAALSVGLLAGFNLVATAPDLHHMLAAWSLFGFSSTFLIGSYADRPTVRNNATYAFAAYRISDFALLTAAAFAAPHAAAAAAASPQAAAIVAGCLLTAAAFKSSQFPLAALFVRSMEGPTPTSALGYAGLSAHAGVVLLASTMDLWYPVDAARAALAGVGVLTAVHNSLIAHIRPDRKGAIARATSASLGVLFALLSMGYSDLVLALSLGHAVMRMVQILRAPNAIADSLALRAALGHAPWPRYVPDWLYRTAWCLYRVDTDFHLFSLLHRMSGALHIHEPLALSRLQRLALTVACVTLAGAPYTPLCDWLDDTLMQLLQDSPASAGALMLGHFAVSVLAVRFLFVSVLSGGVGSGALKGKGKP